MGSYRADIDGLRAIAVVLVILYHAGLGFPGGYIGVDVFFVISGYLITRILYRDLAAGDHSLRRFWLRRTRRIVPAALATCAAVLMAGYFLLGAHDYRELGSVTTPVLVMGANIRFWEQADYFAGSSELKPLLHMWSLAVEEQFYLLFPLLMTLGYRWRKRGVAITLGVLCVGSLMACVWLTPVYPKFAFFMLPTRAWELLLGGLVALAPAPSAALARRWPGVQALALAGLALLACWYTPRTPFPGVAAMAPCVLAACLVWRSAAVGTLAGRVLCSPVLVAIGRASYSAYLWHWPVLVYLKHYYVFELPLGIRLLAVAATAVCAAASYALIEQPIRLRRVLATTPRLLAATSSALATLLILGLVVRGHDGVPGRLPPRLVAIEAENRIPTQYRTRDASGVTPQALPTLGVATRDGAPDFLLWGDSHAVALARVLDRAADEAGLSGRIAARSGTPPLLGAYCAYDRAEMLKWNDAVAGYVQQSRVRHVLLASRWAAYVEGSVSGSADPLVTDDQTKAVGVESARLAFERGLDRTLGVVRGAGARVWLLRQVPLQPHDPFREYLAHAMFGDRQARPGVTLAEHRRRQAWADRLLTRVAAPDVRLLDPAATCFDAHGLSRTGASGVPYYADDDHVSSAGAEALLRPLLDPVLSQIAYAKRYDQPQRTPYIAAEPGGGVLR